MTELMREILKSPTAQSIVGWLSPIYGKAYTMLWLIQIIGGQLDKESQWTQHFRSEMVPQTATWSIDIWEEQYGVTPESWWTLDQRRQNILNRAAMFLPMNPKRLEDLASNEAGAPVKIRENTGKNRFDVTLEGSSELQRSVVDVVNAYKPAHLIYDLYILMKLFFQTRDRFRLKGITSQSAFLSSGEELRRLDGEGLLDGTWQLDQVDPSFFFEWFQIEMDVENRYGTLPHGLNVLLGWTAENQLLFEYLTLHTGFYNYRKKVGLLSGDWPLNGEKTLDQDFYFGCVFHELKLSTTFRVLENWCGHKLSFFQQYQENQGVFASRFLRIHQAVYYHKDEKIKLSGDRNLDGAWQLDQLLYDGPALNTFNYHGTFNEQNQLQASLISDNFYPLDGQTILNGSKKLNAKKEQEDL